MTEDEDFTDLLAEGLAAPDRQPSLERVLAIRRAAEAAAPATPGHPDVVRGIHAGGRRAGRLQRAALGLVGVAAVLMAFAGGRLLAPTNFQVVEAPPEGVIEFRANLAASSGAESASAVGRKAGIGRIVDFRSDSLPILPKGELYEVWFVGPGDAPGSPNRISAGTFHPDDQGRTKVVLTAAVDPAKYTVLSVTAEPGDGRPEPTGPEVLRADLHIIS